MNYSLLIAKLPLHAYGIPTDALEVPLSYLQDRWQRVQINANFSSRNQLLQGAPEGLVLGPIFFNININNILFLLKGVDVCNFADGSTSYVCDSNLKSVLELLEHNSESAIAWFEMN